MFELSPNVVADLPSPEEMQVRMLVPTNQWRVFSMIAHKQSVKPRILLLEILQDYLRDYRDSE